MERKSKLSFIKQTDEKAPDGTFLYLCRCECGNTTKVSSSKFKYKRTLSCGCLRGRAHTHNMTKHPYLARYKAMLARCYNPKNASYSKYGGRGITVCDRWREPLPQGFLNFIEDMGDPPPGHSLERKDNNQGYNQGNCVWATPSTQANNKRNNRTITIGGETKTLAQWSKELNTTTYRVIKALNLYGEDLPSIREYCGSRLYCTNASGHANIRYREDKNRYSVLFTSNGAKRTRHFKTLEEALQFQRNGGTYDGARSKGRSKE